MRKGALAGALRMTLTADDRARVERARDEALGAAETR
jgi:hypothetical protein